MLNTDKLNIGAYYLAPYASTQEHVRDLAACGIDVVMNMRNDREALDLLAENGVGAIVSGIVPGWFGGDGSNAGTMAEKNPLEKYVQAAERFEDHPAVWGIDAGDEPSSLDFKHYGDVIRTIGECFPGKVPYLNIYPSYAVKGSNTPQEIVQQLGTDGYAEYIERFARNVNLPYICFDYYLYSAALPGLYESLSTVSSACRRFGKDMWMVLQVNSHQPDVWISEKQLRFQANCALAFGARTIIWACYCAGWWHNHVLDKAGVKTQQYEKLRRVNGELHRMGEIYMRYRHADTFFVGNFSEEELKQTGKAAMEKISTAYFSSLHAQGGKILVGVMEPRSGGKGEALFIASADDSQNPEDQTYCVTLRSSAKRICLISAQGSSELTCGEDGSYSFEIASCQGVLLTAE